MMRPHLRAAMGPMTSLIMWKAPERFTAISRCQASGVIRATDATLVTMPALFTRISMGPSICRRASIPSCTRAAPVIPATLFSSSTQVTSSQAVVLPRRSLLAHEGAGAEGVPVLAQEHRQDHLALDPQPLLQRAPPPADDALLVGADPPLRPPAD